MRTLESFRRSSFAETRIDAIEFAQLFKKVHGFQCPNFDDFADESDFQRRLNDLREHAARVCESNIVALYGN